MTSANFQTTGCSIKTARKNRSKAGLNVSPALKRTMESSYMRVAAVADKEARKDDKVQREARIAIAETLDEWLAWAMEEDPAQVEQLFYELGCLANATNRRRIFKHAQIPEGVSDKVQDELDRIKAEEEKAKAEADKVSVADAETGQAEPTQAT